MTKTITGKLALLTSIFLIISISLISTIIYVVNHDAMDRAAGEELIGCASITSGLVDPNVIIGLSQGSTIGLKDAQDKVSWIVDHKPIFMDAFIMSLDGRMLVVDDRLRQRGFKEGQMFYVDREALQMVQSMKHAAYTEIYEFDGVSRKAGYAPIFRDHDPSKEVIAVMVNELSETIIEDRTWDMLYLFIMRGGFVPFLLPVLMIFIFIRATIKPVIQVSERLTKMAAGDLTVDEIINDSKDEIGILAKSYNDLLLMLRRIIFDVKKTASSVTSNTTEISNGNQELAMRTEESAAQLEEFTATVETMVNAIKISEEKSAQSESLSKNTMKIIYNGNELVSKMMEAMEQIIRSNERISETINKVNDIAFQTNLLALNAAVEAARVGDLGRGFAVVASEVRSLAGRSAEFATDISNLLKVNEEKVKQGNSMMMTMQTAFGEIVNNTETTSRTVGDIANYIRMQSTSAEELKRTIDELNNVTQQNANLVQDIADNSSSMTGETDKMMKLVNVFRV
jgi:methyl-accepting chemotaxis protein